MPWAGWVQLNEFIRRLTVSETRERSIEQRLEALENGLRDLWGTPTIGGGFSIAVVSGNVSGCSSLGLPGIVVSLTNPSTGAPLGNATTDSSGNYTITLAIVGSSASVKFTAAQPASDTYQRVASHTFTTTVSSGVSSGHNFTLSPNTGYDCLVGFPFPVASSITVVDPQQGSGAATFGSTVIPGFVGWFCNFGSVTIPASGGCPGATSCGYGVGTQQSAVLIEWQYGSHTVGGCPATSTAISTSVSLSPTPTVASSPTGTTQLDYSFAIPSGNAFYGGAASLRFHE